MKENRITDLDEFKKENEDLFIAKRSELKKGNRKLLDYILELNPSSYIYINNKLQYVREIPIDTNSIDRASNISGKTITRISNCSNYIEAISDNNFEHIKVNRAIMCGNKFCPICAKQKSIKYSIGIDTIYKHSVYNKNEHIMLTLTDVNVEGSELKSEIDNYMKSVKRLFSLKRVSKATLGYIAKLEVTYNHESDTYHPHMHILIAVPRSYFKKKSYYIKHEEWLNLWRTSKRNNSLTQVDVRRIKNNPDGIIDSSILEICKYISKPSDYLYSKEVFSTMYNSLWKKKSIRYSGVFKEYRRKFIDGELDNIIFDNMDCIEYIYKIFYRWSIDSYERKSVRELSIFEKAEIASKLLNESKEVLKE